MTRLNDPHDRAMEDAQGILHAARSWAKAGGYFAGSYKVSQIEAAIDAIQTERDNPDRWIHAIQADAIDDLLGDEDAHHTAQRVYDWEEDEQWTNT